LHDIGPNSVRALARKALVLDPVDEQTAQLMLQYGRNLIEEPLRVFKDLSEAARLPQNPNE